MPRDWFDTQLPKPRNYKVGFFSADTAIAIALHGYEYRWELVRPLHIQLWVEPAAYHEARRTVYWMIPSGVLVEIFPLEV